MPSFCNQNVNVEFPPIGFIGAVKTRGKRRFDGGGVVIIHQQVPLKAIERELTCPMCKELFATPLLLPCHHSACRACIKDALLLLGRGSSPGGAPFQALAQEEQHGSQHSSPGLTPIHSPRGPKSPAPGPSPCSPGSAASPVGLAGPLPHGDHGEPSRAQRPVRLTRERSFWKSGYATYPGHRRTPSSPRPSAFPCPVCQRDVELGERGLASLFRNFALEGVVERHRLARGGTIPCQACRPAAPSRAATKSCLDCKSSFCKACFKLHHPWGTPRAQHEFVAPTTSFRPKVLLCPEHEAERVTVYCEVCRRPLCHLCKLGGAHGNHKISSITNAYRTLKDKLSKSIAYLVSKEPEVRARIEDIDDCVRQVEKSGRRAQLSVAESTTLLGRTVDERRQALALAVSDGVEGRLRALRESLAEHAGLLDGRGLVGYAQEVLKEADQACFVQTAKHLHVRICRALESLKSLGPPVVDTAFGGFTLDVSREAEMLANLSFRRVPDAPTLDPRRCFVYSRLALCWTLPQGCPSVRSYRLEFRPLAPDGSGAAGAGNGVANPLLGGAAGGGGGGGGDVGSERPAVWVDGGELFADGGAPQDAGPEDAGSRSVSASASAAVAAAFEEGAAYAVRVRGANEVGAGAWSDEVVVRTPPAPVLRFRFDAGCGCSRERLSISKDGLCARSVAGLAAVLAAERPSPAPPAPPAVCLPVDFVVGDAPLAVRGRACWALRVLPDSFVVRVGVVAESKLHEWFRSAAGGGGGGSGARGDVHSPRYEQDSGHDSGSEEAEAPSPSALLVTAAAGKLLLPRGPRAGGASGCCRAVALPAVLAVAVDRERGTAALFDASDGAMRLLWERPFDCSSPVYPAFGFLGGGAVRLHHAAFQRP
ncbi:tripartite motif-containing protein 46 [Petromyzon marinus]|uniref:Tripartite motif-containing protein 46 n=1 Tax=Petromyzon marinus TaxID=7757 RepID=A0AAJ7U7E9_PETMA|nr:tripartite motif-containing protein 46 [Petromyzon marinus]